MSDNSNFLIQDTIQGLDEGGRTRMLNIRGTSLDEFERNLKALEPRFKQWKPLPVKQFGGGGKPQQAAKEIKTWADVPHCANHPDTLLVPNSWKDHPGVYFWNCPKSRDCKNGTAKQAEFDAYQKLDQDEKPAGVPGTGKKVSAWLSRGKVIYACKQVMGDKVTVEEISAHLDMLVEMNKINRNSSDAEIIEAVKANASAGA
jgi:hypothetical protein